jgi:hypothetical protein
VADYRREIAKAEAELAVIDLKVGSPPHLAVGSVVVKGSFGMRHRQGIVCSEWSLTRMSSAGTPSTRANATPGSAPWRAGP